MPADALGTSGSSSCCLDDTAGRPLALFPVGTTLLLPPLPLVGFLLPVVEPLLPVRGFLDLPPVVEGTAGTGALMAAVGPGKSSGTMGFPLSRDSLDGGVVGWRGGGGGRVSGSRCCKVIRSMLDTSKLILVPIYKPSHSAGTVRFSSSPLERISAVTPFLGCVICL